MRIPDTPPPYRQTIERFLRDRVAGGESERIFDRVAAIRATDDEGRYLPWEDFRFRKPPPDFDIDTYWALVRRARALSSRPVPFVDSAGRPFTFMTTDGIQRALHEIDSNARGVIGAVREPPNDGETNRFLVKSLIEEPFNSSLLEGAATTRDKAKKLIFENREPKTPSERMVLNNYRAIEFIKTRKNDPLTPAVVHELHRLVTDRTLDNPKKAGVFRAREDDIAVVDDATGEILHKPPPANELPARLERLCAFANGGTDRGVFVHPILRAIILHFMLAYDHPYVDGNGRTARALFYWSVLREGYWLLEYVSISRIINEAPVQYGKAFLHTETDESDLTYFLIHQIGVLQKSISALHAFIERKQREIAALSSFLESADARADLNHRQIALLHDAVRSPHARYTIQDHLQRHHVSYLTARSDLEGLAEAGYLRKSKSGVTSVYTAAPALRRLRDAPAKSGRPA